jgi:hypothetical protein
MVSRFDIESYSPTALSIAAFMARYCTWFDSNIAVIAAKLSMLLRYSSLSDVISAFAAVSSSLYSYRSTLISATSSSCFYHLYPIVTCTILKIQAELARQEVKNKMAFFKLL